MPREGVSHAAIKRRIRHTHGLTPLEVRDGYRAANRPVNSRFS